MLPEKHRDKRKIKLAKCCLCREEQETSKLIKVKNLYTHRYYCVECNKKRKVK